MKYGNSSFLLVSHMIRSFYPVNLTASITFDAKSVNGYSAISQFIHPNIYVYTNNLYAMSCMQQDLVSREIGNGFQAAPG